MNFVSVNTNVRKGTAITKSQGSKNPAKPKYDIFYTTVSRKKIGSDEVEDKGTFKFSRVFMKALGVGNGFGFNIQAPEGAELTTNTAVRLEKVSSDAKVSKVFGGAKAKKDGTKVSNFFSSNVVEETLSNAGIIVKGVDSYLTLEGDGTFYTFAKSTGSTVSETETVSETVAAGHDDEDL